MSRSSAYVDFQKRFEEMKRLLNIPKKYMGERKSIADLETESALARSTVVLLAGHLEASFNDLSREIASYAQENWDDLTHGNKKYITTLIYEKISEIIKDYQDENFSETGQFENSEIGSQKLPIGIMSPVPQISPC